MLYLQIILTVFLGSMVGDLAATESRGNPLVDGNNHFAVALYGRFASQEKGNIFCSPYSISAALAMTHGGARGETAAEMARVLNFPESLEGFHEAFFSLTDSLNMEGENGSIELSVANALWGQTDFKFKNDFLDLTRKRYGAGLRELNFRADPEAARRAINTWVAGETRDKIKDLLAIGVLDKSTRLVLTNAIYFKGKWKSKFKQDATQEQPFHLGHGKEIPAQLMTQKKTFEYMETPRFQALELPYLGDKLSMVVLLPRDADGLGALEKELSEKELAAWLSLLRPRETIVYLPRFKTASQFALTSSLRALGMKAAFTPQADFSGMDGKRDLYLSAAVHKAFVEVNEEGTEAAAATALGMHLTSSIRPSRKVFRADHPFLFLIRDKKSGSILFMGRLADPRG